MTPDTILALQRLLRSRFPGVTVAIHDRDNPESYCDVFFLPNSKRREFVKFQIHEYAQAMQSAGLPMRALVFHTVSETEKHYPEIWHEVKPEVCELNIGSRAGNLTAISTAGISNCGSFEILPMPTVAVVELRVKPTPLPKTYFDPASFRVAIKRSLKGPSIFHGLEGAA